MAKKILRPSDRLKPDDVIHVKHGKIREIARAKGYHESTVSEALSKPRDTKIQREIRELAVDFYGGKF